MPRSARAATDVVSAGEVLRGSRRPSGFPEADAGGQSDDAGTDDERGAAGGHDSSSPFDVLLWDRRRTGNRRHEQM
jgi:hypothetical protein